MTQVSSTVLRSIALQRIAKALNKVDTFVNHPSFDTKGSVISQLKSSREACEALHEALTGRFIMDEESWDCDWTLYQHLVARLQSMRGTSDFTEVRSALADLVRANRELIAKADAEYIDCALCESRDEHYTHTH